MRPTIEFDVEKLDTKETKDRSFTIRMPSDHFTRLQEYHPNVSKVIRFLIEEFLEQQIHRQRGLEKWKSK